MTLVGRVAGLEQMHPLSTAREQKVTDAEQNDRPHMDRTCDAN